STVARTRSWSSVRHESTASAPPAAVDMPKPLKSVTGRVPGDLAEQWEARYRELAVPSQVFMAVAMRLLLEQDEGEISRRAAEESFRQAQDKARRRLARS
ncbi:hypothetical protein ACVU7I_00185, partial [Patulibacter sp. S7RM1-6]